MSEDRKKRLGPVEPVETKRVMRIFDVGVEEYPKEGISMRKRKREIKEKDEKREENCIIKKDKIDCKI